LAAKKQSLFVEEENGRYGLPQISLLKLGLGNFMAFLG